MRRGEPFARPSCQADAGPPVQEAASHRLKSAGDEKTGAQCGTEIGGWSGRVQLPPPLQVTAWCVSFMRNATTRPDAKVSAAISQTADSRPRASAVAPATIAPMAYPRSRQKR